MRTGNSIALKEWASVCLALSEGRQSLLVRKGGIAEGSRGFRMEHDEFWLFPTQFHQSPNQLTSDGALLLDRSRPLAPPPGRLRLDCYAVVTEVAFIQDERRLSELAGWHVMADDVVRERFHYRRPGLFVAAVEVFRRAEPLEVADVPAYAGCHSWVELNEELPTSGLTLVRDADAAAKAREFVESLAI